MARILLMEIDRPLGLEIAATLGKAGHDVVLSPSASYAKAELWHWDFDLLTADLVVRKDGKPVADGGLGLISWVRHTATNTEGLNYLPIVAISGEQTGRAMDILLPTADRLGADVVLEKPVEVPSLLRTIVALTPS